jgi:hypothetical protein
MKTFQQLRSLLPPVFILLLGPLTLLHSQQVSATTVAGRVLDDSTGTPIAKVNVFIANSTMGSPTDEEGVFKIRKVPLGTHELIASIVGYAFHSRFIQLTDSVQPLIEIRLKPRALELAAVEVVGADPLEWKRDLAKFTELFFGNGANAGQCRIMNPEVLSFSTDWAQTFEARASQPLRIENKGLGFEMELRLLTFTVGPKWLTYGWRAFFREMPGADDDQREEWQKSQLKAYKGSLRHFCASLVNGRAEREGFSIYAVTNPRLSDGRMRMPVTDDEILSPGSLQNERLLRFHDYLEVEFETGPGMVWRSPRGIAASSNSQISWLQLAHDFVTINSMGEYVEPYSLNVTGAWAMQRVADALPIDFVPPKK